MRSQHALFEVTDLAVDFQTPQGWFNAVKGVSFEVGAGEILGIVGESGSGKSVSGMALMGLLPRSRSKVSGSALLDGTDLLQLSPKELQTVRGNDISMIFQDALSALDPVFTVGHQIVRVLRRHKKISMKQARAEAVNLLDEVGIPSPKDRFHNYPHQMSGGMRQRAMIAIALACEPKVLIADEPTTALDVTIQAQVLDLIRGVAQDRNTAVIFITHDLGVVAELCERVVTMYAGQVVEDAGVDELLEWPKHPYSSGLIRSIPTMEHEGNRLFSIPGRVPALDEMPDGCRFAPRCDFVIPQCQETSPDLIEVGTGRSSRCLRSIELELTGSVPAKPHNQRAL